MRSEKAVLETQSRVEIQARSLHDNFAMNALFVAVEEHAKPLSCSVFQGAIPDDLPAGAILRIGPNGAANDEGWLDGDGLIQCVVIPEDKKTPPVFSSTYVDTRGRSLERDAREKGKRFRGTLGAAPKGLPMLKNLVQNALDFQTFIVQKDTCNTAMARSGGRILALMEQSPPSEIQISRDGRIRTIANMCRLDGAVKEAPVNGGSFGAHGRTDPESGERVHVSYSSNARPSARVDIFGENWKFKSSMGIDLPAVVMIHDCALTKDFVIILDFPLTLRIRRFLIDGFPVEYEPEHGARIGLVPRSGEKGTQWFDVSEGVVLHVANAFQREDGTVVVHGFKSLPKGESSFILDYTPAFFHQWILDPKTGKVLDDRCLNADEMVEFPIVEDRFVGSDPGCIYGLQVTTIGGPIHTVKTPEAGVLLDGVLKLATSGSSAGEVLGRFTLEGGWHFTSEPIVVTKLTSDGHYVVLYTTRVPEDGSRDKTFDEMARAGSLSSRVIILDGDDLAAGPVCSIDLPHHVCYGLHSLFVPWNILTSSNAESR
jgi:carotenoid cleavage dioxygenase